MAYIDNVEFHNELMEYKKKLDEASERGDKILPRVPENIGRKLLLIVNGLAKHKSYCGYTYIDDMISEALDNCVRCVGNYNPNVETKGGTPSPFSYFTMVAARAFHRIIHKERKYVTAKVNMLRNSNVLGDIMSGHGYDEEDMEHKNQLIQYMDGILGKDVVGYGSYDRDEQ